MGNIQKRIRKLSFKLLGTENYLKTLHAGFHFLYSVNALRNNDSYKNHYFDKSMIEKGDYVVDIGANLGYYTKLFAKWVGETGHVYAIEPVSIFANTIQWGTKAYKNITLYNYALGEEEKEVTLSTPGNFGYLRTGLPHVVDQKKDNNVYEFTFSAKMKRGSILFADLPKLDFIKCDIEGYEDVVLPEMSSLLMKFKPVIQLETWGEHKPKVEKFLTETGYKVYDIEDGILKPVEEMKKASDGDLYFIHKENTKVIERLRKLNKAQ